MVFIKIYAYADIYPYMFRMGYVLGLQTITVPGAGPAGAPGPTVALRSSPVLAAAVSTAGARGRKLDAPRKHRCEGLETVQVRRIFRMASRAMVWLF